MMKLGSDFVFFFGMFFCFLPFEKYLKDQP